MGKSLTIEVLAGVTTFMSMAYIILVNPAILSSAGIPFGPIIITTIVVAAISTILTGVYAKKPFAMAPYMGENVLFAFTIVPMLLSLGVEPENAWRIALGAVFWSGVIFLIVSLTGARAVLARAVPRFLAASWSIAIGLFLMFVGFSMAKISLPGVPGAPVRIGGIPYQIETLIALAGTAITLGLLIARIPGSILIGILSTMGLAWLCSTIYGKPKIVLHSTTGYTFPDWSTVILKLDPVNALLIPALIPIILVLFLVDLFDTMGTVVGLSLKAGFVDEQGKVVGVDRVFHVDAFATVFGALLGTSTTGTYIESATGIETGGRTGITSIVTGLLFLATLPLVPFIASLDPDFLRLASAPALIAVGILMLTVARHIEFDDIVQTVTVATAIGVTVFTYNIALGIASSLVVYPIAATIAKRFREVHPLAWVLMAFALLLFIFYPYPKP